MEPKHGRVKQTKHKTMTRISTQKTTASNDNSNGRATGKAKKTTSSKATPPMAPPRLTSNKGGSPVKSGYSRQKPKR